LVSSCGSAIHGGNLVVVGAFSFHDAVVVGVNRAPVLRCLGEGWLKLPSPLDAVRNSLVESSIVARYGVDASLRVEPMKMALSLPLLGDRLKLPK
jgi:hypothetical protein